MPGAQWLGRSQRSFSRSDVITSRSHALPRGPSPVPGPPEPRQRQHEPRYTGQHASLCRERQAQPTTARNNPSLHVGPTSMLPSMDLPCQKEGYASTITLSRIRPPKPAVRPQRLLHPQTHHHILFSRSHTATKSSATAHVVNTGYCSTIYPSLPRIPTRPRLLLVWPPA